MQSTPRFVGELLVRAAERRPDHPALVTATRTLTYRELEQTASRVARGLADLGVRAGDRVSLYAENRWEWVVVYHAVLRLGGVINPVNAMLTARELTHIENDCGAVALVVSEGTSGVAPTVRAGAPGLRHVIGLDGLGDGLDVDFADLLATEGELEPVSPRDDQTSTIGYTSGTTGHPKGAAQTQRAVLANIVLTATMHLRTENDVMVTALPAAHVYGNVAINSTFLAGGTVVLLTRFSAAEALAAIDAHRATMFEGVPTMYAMMIADPALQDARLTTLTRCTVGGQTMSASTMTAWERRTGAPLLELWGMTELAGLGSTHTPYGVNVHGSIGVALPGVDLRVANGDTELPVGEHGELQVRGPIVMEGYWHNPEATAEAITDSGWLRTGDVAYMDETGHFFVVDRMKDVILTGGYNVYPAEIERVLAGYPGIAMVAVGKVPDEIKGELAVAYVVARDGAVVDEDEVIAFCREHLAPYKLPRAVAVVDALPMTSTGKIMRRELGATTAVSAHG